MEKTKINPQKTVLLDLEEYNKIIKENEELTSENKKLKEKNKELKRDLQIISIGKASKYTDIAFLERDLRGAKEVSENRLRSLCKTEKNYEKLLDFILVIYEMFLVIYRANFLKRKMLIKEYWFYFYSFFNHHKPIRDKHWTFPEYITGGYEDINYVDFKDTSNLKEFMEKVDKRDF